MPKKWTWDLAFDWSTVLHGDYYYLLNGFVDAQMKHSNLKYLCPPGSPFDLEVGDQIDFLFYDVTPGALSTDNYTLSAQFEFTDAQSGLPSALLDKGASFTLAPVKQSGKLESGIFSVRDSVTRPSFFWYKTSDVLKVVQPTNGFRFLMTVKLTVTKEGGGTKIFWVDPEMVVGGMSVYMEASAKRLAS